MYMVGQSFLFLACVFAFTWSYMIARYITATKEELLNSIHKTVAGHYRIPNNLWQWQTIIPGVNFHGN